jgi:hypothetical protein
LNHMAISYDEKWFSATSDDRTLIICNLLVKFNTT